MNLHLTLPHADASATISWFVIAGFLLVFFFVALSVPILAKKRGIDSENNKLTKWGQRWAKGGSVSFLAGFVLLIVAAVIGGNANIDAANHASITNDTRLIQAAKTTYGIDLPREAAYNMLLRGSVPGDTSYAKQKLGTGSYLEDEVVQSATLYHLGSKWVLVNSGTQVELTHVDGS